MEAPLRAAGYTWDFAPATAGWQDGPGTWTTTGTNWLSGASNVSWVNGNDALIGGGATGNGGSTLSLGSNISVANLVFGDAPSGSDIIQNSGSNTFTLTVTGTMADRDGNASSIASNVNSFFTNGMNVGNTTVGSTAFANSQTITINGTSTVTGNISMANGGGLKLAGVETGATDMNVSGGTLTLAGTSTITGNVNVTGGTLDLTTTTMVANGWQNITVSAGTVKLTGTHVPTYSGTFGLSSSGAIQLTGSYTGAIGTGAGQMNITGGSLNGAGVGGIYNFTVGGTSTGTLVWGSAGFNPASTFNLESSNSIMTILNPIDLNGANRTIQDGANGTSTLILAGGIVNSSGSAANLTLSTPNGNSAQVVLFVLTGSNTYSGTTTLSGGGIRYQLGNGSSANAALVNTPAIVIAANSQFGINLSGTTTISAVISGSPTTSGFANDPGQTLIIGGTTGGFTAGAGTTILTGSNTYGGGTLIKSGILQIGNGGTTGYLPSSTTISGSSTGTIAYNHSDNISIGGTITGALNLTQMGSGTLTLTGSSAQNYTGVTTISNGTLRLGDGTSDGAISSSGTIANSGALIFNNVRSETFAGKISGAGSLTKSGSGNQLISGANNYTGATFVNSGTLQLGSASSMGNTSGVTVASGATLNLSNNSTTQTITLTGSTGNTLTLNGGSILNFGVGNGSADQLVLTSGATPSISGTTTISITSLANANVTNYMIISSPTGGLNPGGVNPSFVLGTLPALTSGSLTISSTSVLLSFQAVTTVYWSGAYGPSWTAGPNAGANFTSDAAGTQPLNGMFGSAQDVVFSGSNANFSTITTLSGSNISARSLTINDPNGVGINGSTSTLTLSAASGNTGIIVNNGAGAASITTNVALVGTPNITVNSANGLSMSGTISGANGILVNGSGLLTLTGNNTFTGGTVLQSGTLNINADAALGGTGSSVTFSGSGAGGTLQAGASITSGTNRNYVFGSGTGTIDTQANTFTINGLVSGTGVLNKAGSGLLVLTGANTGFGGTASVGSGTMQIQNLSSWLGVTLSSTFNTSPGGTLNLLVNSLMSYTPAHSVTFGGSGTLLLSGNNSLQTGGGNNLVIAMSGGTIEIGSGVRWESGGPTGGGPTWTNNKASMQIDASGTFDPWDNSSAAAPINIDALTGSGQLNRSGFGTGGAWVTMGVNNGSGTFNGSITNTLGTVSITKTGTGTQTFSGSNGYSGFTAVTGGTLKVTGSSGLGFGDQTFVSVGGVADHTTAVSGSATLDLSGAGTVNNAVTLNGGSLINSSTSAASTLDSGVAGVTFTSDPGASAPVTVAFGSGSATATTGTNGNNMYVQMQSAGSGYTPGNAPTVTLTQSGSGVGGTVAAVVSSLTLSGSNNTIGGAGNLAINAQISGTSGYNKIGAGTLTVSGSNIYSGPTTVNQGNLSVTNSAGSATGSGNVNVTANTGTVATLSGNGFVGGLVTTSSTSALVGTAHLAPGINVSGANGNFGAAGTLHLSNGLTIGDGTNLDFDLGPTSDLVSVTGNLSLGNNVVLNYQSLGGSIVGNTTYDLINFTGTLSGTASLASWTAVGTPPAGTLSTTFAVTSGSMITVTFNIAASAPGTAYWQGSVGSSGTGAWNTVSGGQTNFTTDAAGTTNTVVIPSAATNVKFTANSGSNVNTVLGQDFTINSLEFTGTATTAATTPVTIGGTNTLTLNASGTNGNTAGNGITVDAGSAAHTISSKVALGASQTWTVNGGALTVSGNITDSGSAYALTKSGTGTLVLSGSDSYTGATTVNAGALRVDGSLAAGSAVTVNAATLEGVGTVNGGVSLTGSGRLRSLGNLTLAQGFSVSGTGNSLSSGTITGNATQAANSAFAVNGTLNGTDALASGASLSGTGSVGATTLAGNNNLSSAGTLTLASLGVTGTGNTISSGTVNATGGTTLGANSNLAVNGTLGGGAVTTGSGAILSGTGRITSAITVSAGGKTYPSNGVSAAVLTMDLTYNSGATAAFGVFSGTTPHGGNAGAGTAYDQIIVTGAGSPELQIGAGTAASQISLGSNGSAASGVTLTLSMTTSVFNALQAGASSSYQGLGTNTGLNNYYVFELGAAVSDGRFQTLDLNINGTDYTGTIQYGGTGFGRFGSSAGVTNTLGDVVVNGQEFAISYVGDYSTNSTTGGHDIVLTAIPEPGTWGMILGGFGMLIGFQKLRRRRVGT